MYILLQYNLREALGHPPKKKRSHVRPKVVPQPLKFGHPGGSFFLGQFVPHATQVVAGGRAGEKRLLETGLEPVVEDSNFHEFSGTSSNPY